MCDEWRTGTIKTNAGVIYTYLTDIAASGLRTVTDVTNYVIIIIIIILIIIMHIIFNKYDTVSLTLLFAEESWSQLASFTTITR